MCFVKSPPSLVEGFARQGLIGGFDIAGISEAVGPCKVDIKAIEAIFSGRKVDCWPVPASLVPEQTLRGYFAICWMYVQGRGVIRDVRTNPSVTVL